VIRIKKPTQAPAILQNRGARATLQLCHEHDFDPAAHKGWSFDSSLYGAKSVKTLLRMAQHDKCAFCESKFSHVAYGDVEHFRPKGGYRQRLKDPLVQPGYYWLAYEWSNLLFCCQLCNQAFKRNHFPLADDTKRARTHHDDLKNEQPLLIHPAQDDPREFLEFNEEYLRAIDGNQRGKATIEVLGLNRERIAGVRRTALARLKLLIKSRELFARQVAEHPNPELVELLAMIDAQLVESTSDSAEYAAMFRAVLRGSTWFNQDEWSL